MLAHVLFWPLFLFERLGVWLDDAVLSPWQMGTTAWEILEQQLVLYGVLSYLVYKCSRLVLDAYPLYTPAWAVSRAARAAVLLGALIVTAWIVTCAYVGTLLPLLQLQVSYGGLLAAPAVAWVAMLYAAAAAKVRERREAAACLSPHQRRNNGR